MYLKKYLTKTTSKKVRLSEKILWEKQFNNRTNDVRLSKKCSLVISGSSSQNIPKIMPGLVRVLKMFLNLYRLNFHNCLLKMVYWGLELSFEAWNEVNVMAKTTSFSLSLTQS